MHLNAPVVAYKPKFPEAIHEKADARPGRPDHVSERLLRNGRDKGVRAAGLAKFCHDQKNPREALFAGVKELVDKIRLGTHAASEQEFQEQIGKCRLVMHHANHFTSVNLESGAGTDGRGGGQTQTEDGCERLFSNKICR